MIYLRHIAPMLYIRYANLYTPLWGGIGFDTTNIRHFGTTAKPFRKILAPRPTPRRRLRCKVTPLPVPLSVTGTTLITHIAMAGVRD